jgi:hypothetical protein
MHRIESMLTCMVSPLPARYSCPKESHQGQGIETHSETEVKVVFRPSTHNTVETVDGVRDSKLSLVQRLDLFRVTQIGLSSDNILGALGRLGLDNVDQDEMEIWRPGVFQQFTGELNH